GELCPTLTNPEFTGLITNRNIISKIAPLVRTVSGYSIGQYSTSFQNDDMDFQCRGLEMSTERFSEIQQARKIDTKYSSVYGAAQSGIGMESVVKRQARARAP